LKQCSAMFTGCRFDGEIGTWLERRSAGVGWANEISVAAAPPQRPRRPVVPLRLPRSEGHMWRDSYNC
jgi:hypothetical protein